MVHAEAEGADQSDPVDRLNPDDIKHKGQGGAEPPAVLFESQGGDPQKMIIVNSYIAILCSSFPKFQIAWGILVY